MAQGFDAIVIGLGAMGGGALAELAQRGARVLGIEQFTIPNDRGSSHGQTRIIRESYFEHPAYVPLVREATRRWDLLEQRVGRQLVFRIGLLVAGRPDGAVMAGLRQTERVHGVELESMSPAEAGERWPAFALDAEMTVCFEPQAGYLLVEACVDAQIEVAQRCGATVRVQEAVRHWSADERGVRVETDRGTYHAKQLAVCGGAWSASLLSGLRLGLRVRRQPVFWYPRHGPVCTLRAGMPVFGIETLGGFYYGFPAIDRRGVKVGEHLHGAWVDDPAELDRTRQPTDDVDIAEFLSRHLPSVTPPPGEHAVCMYTMTPDEHFVIGSHPSHEQVVLAAGFSGHGFKFAPVVGVALADLLEGRDSQWTTAYFDPQRTALGAAPQPEPWLVKSP